jgi:hypothetical protein
MIFSVRFSARRSMKEGAHGAVVHGSGTWAL